MSILEFAKRINFERCLIMDEKLPIEAIIRRVRYDRLEHRIEYRRSILAKFLTDQRTQIFPEVFEVSLSSYADIQKLYAMVLKINQKSLRILQLNKKEDMKEIEYVKENIDLYQFILELLAREKNWVNKFLKN